MGFTKTPRNRGEPHLRRTAILLVLVSCWGCQPGTPATRDAGTGGSISPARAEMTRMLTNRVWARSDSTGLPGVMRIFLSDGTLLMDSCWETYRLCPWRMESDGTLQWQEDAVDIRAAVLRVDAQDLVLRLHLVGGDEEEHYRLASVPYVCPDMKR